MPTLKTALKEMGDRLTGIEREVIAAGAAAYMREGYKPAEANERSVQDLIRQAETERGQILKRVENFRSFIGGDMDTNQFKNDLFYRDLPIDQIRINKSDRTMPLSFSSEEPVKRWFGWEVLKHGRKNVDMDRIRNMGVVLMNHNPDKIIGPLKDVKITGKRGQGTVRFDDDDLGEYAMKKVVAKSLKGVSVGYAVHEFREIRDGETYEGLKGPGMVAERWEPYEVSMTPIPADMTVGVGRSAVRSLDGIEVIKSKFTEDTEMDEKTVVEILTRELPAFLNTAIKDSMQEAIENVRTQMADDQKPKWKISPEEYAELMGRAGAISDKCKIKVADLAGEGRTKDEIINEILTYAAKPADARDAGGGGDDLHDTRKKGNMKRVQDMSNEEFADMILNPIMFNLD